MGDMFLNLSPRVGCQKRRFLVEVTVLEKGGCSSQENTSRRENSTIDNRGQFCSQVKRKERHKTSEKHFKDKSFYISLDRWFIDQLPLLFLGPVGEIYTYVQPILILYTYIVFLSKPWIYALLPLWPTQCWHFSLCLCSLLMQWTHSVRRINQICK